MKKNILSILVILVCVMPSSIYATPGRLRGNSIRTCNGQVYGQHGDGHWHVASQNSNGTYNASGGPLSNPCDTQNSTQDNYQNPTPRYREKEEIPEVVKSSDTTLSTVTVNKDTIELSELMKYQTDEETAHIEVVSSDEKATLNYNSSIELTNGENSVDIQITAEDGTSKGYELIIIRNEPKSNNTNIEVQINGDILTFNNNKSTYRLMQKDIDMSYKLEDSKATTNLETDLKVKNNSELLVSFTVIAEDGTMENYEINVIGLKSKQSDAVIGALFVGGIVSIFDWRKYRKNKGKHSF